MRFTLSPCPDSLRGLPDRRTHDAFIRVSTENHDEALGKCVSAEISGLTSFAELRAWRDEVDTFLRTHDLPTLHGVDREAAS